jgi:hypothetical protein
VLLLSSVSIVAAAKINCKGVHSAPSLLPVYTSPDCHYSPSSSFNPHPVIPEFHRPFRVAIFLASFSLAVDFTRIAGSISLNLPGLAGIL